MCATNLVDIPLVIVELRRKPLASSPAGVLIWRYDTIVGARASYCGIKHEIFGASTFCV